jgi:DNA-directed RNA polymerase subunit RPC12/RpoP
MSSTLTCRACGHLNEFESSQPVNGSPCAECGKPLSATQSPTAALKFACPSCGRKFATKPELAGKKVKCNGCGAAVQVPGGKTASVASESSRPAMKTFGPASGATASGPEDSSLLDELAALEGQSRRSRAEAVLPSRSEVMQQVREKVAEEEAIKAQKAAATAKKKKRKKKSSSYFDPKETLKLIAGVGVGVGLLSFFAWAYPDMRFPLGGLLCIVGFIVYILGLVSLRQLVAEEGPVQALLFRFCPPYQWYFVMSHWGECKDYVVFFGAGLVILSLGGAVLKSSPIGKMAEASERAYQKAKRGTIEEPAPPPVMPKAQND